EQVTIRNNPACKWNKIPKHRGSFDVAPGGLIVEDDEQVTIRNNPACKWNKIPKHRGSFDVAPGGLIVE
ncbi:hypothetical protein CBL17_25425, partial [Shigella sonnei]